MTTSTPSIRRHLEWDRLRQSQAAKYARTTATGDVPQPSDRSDCIEQCASCDCAPRETQPGRFDEMAVWDDQQNERADAAARSARHAKRWGLWLALLGVPALVVAIGLWSALL